MPTTLKAYKVFIASAGGLDEFRTEFRAVVQRFNEDAAHHSGVIFLPVGWEDTVGGMGRAQALINDDLRQCDYALFMFRNRWGSPPDTNGPYTSGTEEEWAIANEQYDKKNMKDIQGCFFPFLACQTSNDNQQQAQVLAFKKKLEGEKKFFFKTFKQDEEFGDWLRTVLHKWLRNIQEIEKDESAAKEEARNQFLQQTETMRLDAVSTSTKTAQSPFEKSLEIARDLFKKEKYAECLGATYGAQALAMQPLEEARTLLLIGVTQGQLGQSEEEIKTYHEVLRRFGDASEAALKEQVAKALVNKGFRQGQLGQSEEAIKTYDEVLRRFGDASEAALKEPVARALFNKGFRQGQLGQSEEEIKTYDEVLRRFGDASEVALKEQVAKALVNKGVRRGQLGQSEEAIKTYDEVLRRFGDASEAALKEPVARALFNKGITHGQLGQSEEATKTYDEVIRRFGDASDAALKELVARALFNKGVAQG